MSKNLNQYIIDFLQENDKSSQEQYDDLKYGFRNKGYGNRDEELSFIKDFFTSFFDLQFDVFQVEWQQYQDYNDNWYYYDVHDVRINQTVEIQFSGFDDAEDKVWKYTFSTSQQEGKDFEEMRKVYAELERESNYLRKQIDKVFTFLRALYDYYGGYYFIFIFGHRAKVTISNQGIFLENEDQD